MVEGKDLVGNFHSVQVLVQASVVKYLLGEELEEDIQDLMVVVMEEET